MQTIRNLTLVMSVLLIAGCSSFTGKNSPTLSRSAQWGVVPLVNYSQTPQAGERSEQILLSVLSSKGLHPQMYPVGEQGEQALLDDNERLSGAMDWARQQKLDYVVAGSVEEWQYKNGLDGEPAVGSACGSSNRPPAVCCGAKVVRAPVGPVKAWPVLRRKC